MLKLSTRKIIGISTGVLALMLATLAIPNAVAKEYSEVLVVALGIIVSVALMGWAKPRNGNQKLIATLIIAAAIVFQVATFLLLGFKLGFVQNVYAWNLGSIVQIFLPVTLLIVGEEILRGQLIERGKGSLLAVITAGVTVCVVTILTAMSAYNLAEAQGVFIFLTTVAGPAVLTNILLTYIAYTYDYRINIGYRLVMELPVYLLPVLPDAGVFLPLLLQIGLILLLSFGLVELNTNSERSFAAMTTQKKTKRISTDQEQRLRRVVKWTSVGIVAAIMIVYAALMSGLFKYYVLAIGSGSMEPNIARGDLVLVEKRQDYDQLKEGEVLVFWQSDVIVVHRITEVWQDGKNYTFTTKGDANGTEDKWTVREADVVGVARGRIAAFGYPTIWLNELFNGGK